MAYQVTTVLPSAARTTSGVTGIFPSDTDELALDVTITAISGTPTLGLAVEWSFDGVTFVPSEPVSSITAFDASIAAAPTGVIKLFKAPAPYYRIAYTIGGTTPSVTFSADTYTN